MKIVSSVRGSYGALRLLSGLTKPINVFCRRVDRKKNAAIRAAVALPPGRINGQALPPYGALPYGAWSVAFNGCEVIAVYNALIALHQPVPFAEIADALEKKGLLFNGFGGTNLSAVAAYLRSLGIHVTILRRGAREQYDEALAGAECAILSYWTGPTLRQKDGSWNMLHTVSVQHGFAGVEICNVTVDWPAPRPARSVADYLKRENGDPVCLFLLRNRRNS